MKSIFFLLLLLGGNALAQEDQLIAVLKSDAAFHEKADACLELSRVATRQAVPALAALLTDTQLSHRARAALETIADPTVDAVLRQALGQLRGPSLVGVIQTLGNRQDPQAVEPLATLLTGPDPTVAQAAARALGRIGGAAAPALEGALAKCPPANLPAVGEGLLRCAEALPAPKAVALYDQLRALPDLPHPLRFAAVSEAVRRLGPQGIPLLSEAIRTGSPVPAADAIRMSMDLAGDEVTRALVGAVPEVNEETQILLLHAVGCRGDVSAAPALVALARNGSAHRRIAAIRSLVQLGSAPSLTPLIALIQDPDPAVAGVAWTGLAGLPGREADGVVMALLTELDTKTRVAAIGAVEQRRIRLAVPALLKAAGDAEAGVASASFKALGELGETADIPGVVQALLRTESVAAAETALAAICERQTDPVSCAERLLPGLGAAKGEAKLALVRVVGSLGGPRALEAVRAATSDSDESVRETACRALCDWPTPDALPDLVLMTRKTADRSLKSLALRGQLRLILLQQTATPAHRVGLIQESLPIIEQMNEQRLALSTLGQLHCPESLAVVLPYLSRSGFREEASVAAVTIAEAIVTRHPSDVAPAMRSIQSTNEQLAKRVRQVLAQLPAAATEVGFIPIFNGKDLTGWDGKPGWWKVENGTLTAESTPANPCDRPNYLVWRGGQPADFELLADFRLSSAGNSGIQLRSRALPDWDTSGYQADMSGDGALVGFVYEHTRGLIAGRGERVGIGPDGKREAQKLGDPAELLKSYKKEDWNTYRIICRGPEITLFINGTLMCQFTDRDAKQAASQGFIALQMHPGPPMKIEFRNLRLKEL